MDKLTDREREVLALIAEGLNNQAISDRLLVSTHTVKTHIHHILTKLDLSSRYQAAAFWHDHQDVHPPRWPRVIAAPGVDEPDSRESLPNSPWVVVPNTPE